MIRKDRVIATIAGVPVGAVLAVVILLGFRGCVLPVPQPGPGPGPAPTPVNKIGTHVVALIDDTAPSIPLALVLDDNQTRALKLAGKFSHVGITEKLAEEHGYGQLLEKAGGAPAMLILTDAGKLVHAGRFPTDRKVRDELLAKYMTTVPPPLPDTPKQYRAIDRGGPLNILTGADGSTYIDQGGQKRLLSARVNAQKFGGLPKYSDHQPVFPVNQWFEVDRSNIFGGDDHILNQGEISSCVGNGWAGTLRRSRVMWGMKDVKLSPGFVYSLINGNRDAGAIISDGIEALTETGTCTYETLQQKPFYQSQIPQSAKREAKDYRIDADGAERCDTWAETVSAVLAGRMITFGIQVGNNWGRFDQYGVCGHDRGPGNHCVAADGVKKLPDGRWVLLAYNSWGSDWGPYKNGRMLLDEKHLFGPGVQADVCAIRRPARTPNDPHKPPKYVPAAADFPLAP